MTLRIFSFRKKIVEIRSQVIIVVAAAAANHWKAEYNFLKSPCSQRHSIS